MREDLYDKTSVDSIYEFARGLTGKSLLEAVGLPEKVVNKLSRGALGNMVEEFYFGYKPNSDPRPDFPAANLELKITGVIKNSKNDYVAKERLVLSKIDFEEVVREIWESSSLLFKCRLMLIMFYLYDREQADIDRRFVLDPMVYDLLKFDEEVIKRDWHAIRNKIKDGKAHELSEGDTFFLGACRKGAGGPNEKLKKQPYSNQLAKARAFSFKQSYLTQLIQGHEADAFLFRPGMTIEESTKLKFEPFIGKSIEEISRELGHFKRDKNHKGFNRELAVRMLGADPRRVAELAKADIEMKTIRTLNTGMPKESMSFPAFRYLDLLDQNWEDSTFFERIERKFLFIVFEIGVDGVERLKKVAYWNMPYEDRIEAQRVWEDTKRRVTVDARDLPKENESHVAHVRPKAKNANDRNMSPQGEPLINKCFWLNRKYIGHVIAEI
jgi:DNA mismatch repair protein MutH